MSKIVEQSTDAAQGPDDTVASTMSGLFGRDSIYLITWILPTIVAAAVTPVATRVLGTEPFGSVAAATAVMQVLFVIAGCGLQVAVQRWFAGPDGRDAAARLLSLVIVAAAVVTGVAYATGPLWSGLLGFDAFDGPVQLAVVWAGVSAVTAAALSLLRSQDRLVAFTVAMLLQSVGAATASLVLIASVSPTAEAYLTGQLLAQLLATAVALTFVPPRLPRLRDMPVLRAGLAYGLPLVPATLGGFVLGAADRLMVQMDLGPSEVARYQVAYNIGALPMLALGALTTVWMPRFFAVTDDAHRSAALAASRVMLNRLLAPVVLGMSLASPLVLDIWAPAEFRPDDLTLVTAIVIVSAVPYTAVQSATRVLLSRSSTRAVAWSTVAAAAGNIGLNLFLIPAFGIAGAAVATFLAYLLQYGLMLVATGRPDSPPSGNRSALVSMLGGGALALLTAVVLPVTAGWLVVRLVLALLCLGWFGWLMRRGMRPDPSPAAVGGHTT